MIEKQLRKYIIPNMIAMTSISCYILADTYFIAAAQGANGITALNLVLPVYGLIFAIGSMIGTGAATRYSLSKHIGAKDYDQYFTNALIWTIIISVIFVLAGIFFPDAILKIMGADQTILKTGHRYIQIILCCTPFFMLNYSMTSFVRNDGAPKIAMTATLISGISNIILDYVLMFPMHLGMAGAALATGLSPLISMMISMVHYLSKKNTVSLVKMRPSFKKLIASCQLGMVAFVGEIASGLTTMVFNFLLLQLVGNVAVAAYGIIANTALVGIALLNGVAQGLQPLASEMHGKKEYNLEKKIYHHSLLIGTFIALILIILILIFGDEVIRIFNSEHSLKLARLANQGIRLYFIGFFFADINIITAGFYSATGKSKASSLIAVSRGIILIIFFAFVLSCLFGQTGVWLAFPAAELTTLCLSLFISKTTI